MPITSTSSAFLHTSKSGSRQVELELIWADSLGGVAQALIATCSDAEGRPLKRFTLPGPFSGPGSAREAAATKATAWFDYGIE